MGNIRNYNFDKLKLRLSNSDYWDMYLSNDESSLHCKPLLNGSCNVVWYDFNNEAIYSGRSIYSLHKWDKAINKGVVTENFGLTGIDNGAVSFDKNDDPKNENLVDTLTGTTLIIPSGETRLILNEVSGSTNDVSYNIETLQDNGYFYRNLCGGFYQGFFKLEEYDYEVLPSRVNQSWSAEFWLKPQNFCSEEKTLNSLRPNNKGFFFYMGTRSENKFWNIFTGNSSGCTVNCEQDEGCFEPLNYWCTQPKETELFIVDEESQIEINLSPPRIDIEKIKNQFLIYGRANPNNRMGYINRRCSGPGDGLGRETACSYDGNGIFIGRTRDVLTNFQNPFLIYGRANPNNRMGYINRRCSGPGDGLGRETACSFSGMSKAETEIDYSVDLIDNALGFRITDSGAIGYRYLTYSGNCYNDENGKRVFSSGLTVTEDYSVDGLISENEWNYIVIKFVTNFLSDCELKLNKQRKGNYLIYVNARLKHIFRNVPELMFKSLDEYKEKQIGVPFNISIGGGSQGLFESVTFDGLDMDDRNLIIEENFAGSFIGGISDFKFNICDLKYCNIQLNYFNNKEKYELIDEFLIDYDEIFIIDEEEKFIITPSNTIINLIDENDNFISDEDNNIITNM